MKILKNKYDWMKWREQHGMRSLRGWTNKKEPIYPVAAQEDGDMMVITYWTLAELEAIIEEMETPSPFEIPPPSTDKTDFYTTDPKSKQHVAKFDKDNVYVKPM